MPTLAAPPGVDLAAYCTADFSSASATRRCRTGRSRSRWTARRSCRSGCSTTVRDRLAGGGSIAHLALAVAGWIRYASGIDEAGQPIAVSDPLAADLRRDRRRRPRRPGRGSPPDSSTSRPVFGADLVTQRDLSPAVSTHVGSCFATGRRTLAVTLAHLVHRADAMAARPRTSIPTGCFPPIRPRAHWRARLYATVDDLPIVSPHGHTDPQWFADDTPFANASALFITPDHYVFRMLYSQGIALEDLGIPRRDGGPVEQDARKIWRTFAARYHLFLDNRVRRGRAGVAAGGARRSRAGPWSARLRARSHLRASGSPDLVTARPSLDGERALTHSPRPLSKHSTRPGHSLHGLPPIRRFRAPPLGDACRRAVAGAFPRRVRQGQARSRGHRRSARTSSIIRRSPISRRAMRATPPRNSRRSTRSTPTRRRRARR